MEQEWNTFSPNKSEYYENEFDKKPFNDSDQYLLHQLELNMYENPEKLEDFSLDNYQFVLDQGQGPGHASGAGNGANGGAGSQGQTPSHGRELVQTPTSLQQISDGMFGSNGGTPGLGLVQGPQGLDLGLGQYQNHQNQHQHQQNHQTAPAPGPNGPGAGGYSTAFPPNTSVQNTPSLLPNKRLLNQVVSSPILPSQNDKSFNNQHYYHKLSRSQSKELYEHQPQLQHVRPDVIFTPLVSPHDTPVDKKYAVQASFEPLTSPALQARGLALALNQGQAQSLNQGQALVQGVQGQAEKRRTSSSAFPSVDENKPTSFKRRTPHGTPIMPANYDNRNSKSPTTFERLPDTSYSSEYSNSAYGTPMLPPQSFKKIDENGYKDNGYKETSTYKKAGNGNGKGSSTSPQLMGFTMGKLAKQQEESESPVLRSRKSSFTSSKSSDTSPNLAANGLKKEKPPTKKASHKLAEQGRRNRMNIAVQSLGLLIPQSYHDQVAVPSKATTVELASQYIGDLLEEIERMKR